MEGSSSCQRTLTLIGQDEERKKIVVRMLSEFSEYARRFPQGRWSFLVPGSEKKWYGTHLHKPDGERDKTAEGMMHNFAESGHPVLRATSALERGELKSKVKGKKSTHFQR